MRRRVEPRCSSQRKRARCRSAIWFALLVGIGCSSSPVLAMPRGHGVPDDQDIVVRGRTEDARQAAKSYVGQVSARADNQLARFHAPVCPLVIGMPAPYGEMLAARILQDARDAGAPVASTRRCDANLIVIFADDGAALVRDMRSKRPGWLEGLDSVDIDRLLKPGAVRVWSVKSLRNESGEPLTIPPEGSGSVGDPLSGHPTLLIKTVSMLHESTRRDIEASFVVIDEQATYGHTLNQLADYAAMRGLANTRPPPFSSGGLSTILTLFDPEAAEHPVGMTVADAGYLKSLYAGRGLDRVLEERNRIARDVAKQVEKAGAP